MLKKAILIGLLLLLPTIVEAKQVLSADQAKQVCAAFTTEMTQELSMAEAMGYPRAAVEISGKNKELAVLLNRLADMIYAHNSLEVKRAMTDIYNLCIKDNTGVSI